MTNTTAKIDWVVYDLGGVLIELDGPPVSPAASPLSEAEIWDTWLHCTAVRRYEAGQCSLDEFAAELIHEFKLKCSPEQFIEDFQAWPVGPFPEAEPLVRALSANLQQACLSNTNDLHWQRFSSETELYSHLDLVFLSFEMGLMKPDPEIFHAAQTAMNAPPERILFLDDNLANVTAAANCGWQSAAVKGFPEVTNCLKQYGLL